MIRIPDHTPQHPTRLSHFESDDACVTTLLNHCPRVQPQGAQTGRDGPGGRHGPMPMTRSREISNGSCPPATGFVVMRLPAGKVSLHRLIAPACSAPSSSKKMHGDSKGPGSPALNWSWKGFPVWSWTSDVISNSSTATRAHSFTQLKLIGASAAT